jgi:PTH1 family peptidyl-tRNA hydrolase
LVSLVVGLGNPGAEYDKTRHNAGFWFIERLASQEGVVFSRESKFQSDVAKIQVAGQVVYILKPTTFMNRSGQSVASLASYFGVEPRDILVVHDELDLDPGKVRLKLSGGHGGHNGLRDIISQLGTKDFMRLRLGVGHPGSSNKVLNYVLGRPSVGDRVLIDGAVDRSLRELGAILGGESQKVMTVLHAG